MEFTIKSGSPEKQRSACVVVGVFDNRKLSLSAELIDRASNGYISEIIRRKRAVSAEMALKLGRLFNVSAELWMGIQADYDLEMARDRSEAGILRRIHPFKLASVA